MRTIAVIPARMASTRFPNKPLADIHGIPLVLHCFFRTNFAQSIDEVFIATCDTEIIETAHQFGAEGILTSSEHLNAVDRTAEAAAILDSIGGSPIDIVVLVQGDEPLLEPNELDHMVSTLNANPGIDVVNLMVPFENQADFMDPNNPKVVTDSMDNAMYMSREPIPTAWRSWNSSIANMQTGLFAFRPSALEWFTSTPRTPLEEVEHIDMLRLLYHGRQLKMLKGAHSTVGVDTLEDLLRARDLLLNDALFQEYKYRGLS